MQSADNSKPECQTYASGLDNDKASTEPAILDFNSDTLEEPKSHGELDSFILELLAKPTERLFLLKLEHHLQKFIRNHGLYRLDLPPMNSYQRLMVHKVAPYFSLSHFFDSSRQSLFLCKTPYTNLPSKSFSELVKPPGEPEGASNNSSPTPFKIMKREPSSGHQQSLQQQSSPKRVLTLEERKLAYEQARARIFNDEKTTS
ncbi:hypothetical protein DM01DRAFT_1201502 [Hesseltinella vesiculosa]|uniref:R3H domain-containing protein n=1 Tax=Hesseltinella vesiculosa TaxID=101127 RepID=A0A1X2G311_9FUNG|nr:hypothetical protein DM01DRAFT_1201502 [Hesseltinella vesiculosa]